MRSPIILHIDVQLNSPEKSRLLNFKILCRFSFINVQGNQNRGTLSDLISHREDISSVTVLSTHFARFFVSDKYFLVKQICNTFMQTPANSVSLYEGPAWPRRLSLWCYAIISSSTRFEFSVNK